MTDPSRMPQLPAGRSACGVVPNGPVAEASQRPEASPLKVLVFTTVFPSPSRPVHGIFVQERLRHLAHTAAVRVVAPVPRFPWSAKTPRRATSAGLRVEHPTFFYLPGLLKSLDGFLLFLSSLPCVTSLRREFDFDLIDAHFAFPDGFAAILLGWWFRRRVVITLRGTLLQISAYRLRCAAAGWALRRAERIIAVSQPLADRAHELGVPRDRITVVGNGVDTDRFRPVDPGEARRRLGLPERGKLLVSVGHLSSRKGFDRVLRLLPGLLRRYPDLTLAIVGGPGAEGNVRERLDLLVRELALSEHVLLAGMKPPAELALWMSAADLFVLASDFEGSPNVVWEALACGCPVVVTDVGDLRHLVPDYAGIICGPANDEARLDAGLRAGLAHAWDRARIRAFASGHTWDAVAARVLEQWRMATGRLPSHPPAP